MSDDYEGRFNREMRQGLDSVQTRDPRVWDKPLQPIPGRDSFFGTDVRVWVRGQYVPRDKMQGVIPCWIVIFWCGCGTTTRREDGRLVALEWCERHRT